MKKAAITTEALAMTEVPASVREAGRTHRTPSGYHAGSRRDK
jgi:hypothetical protein